MVDKLFLYIGVAVAAILTFIFYPDPNGYSVAYDVGILGTSTANGKYLTYHAQDAAIPAVIVAVVGLLIVHFLL